MASSAAHRTCLFLALVLCGIAASQGIELFVNRILRPNAKEITWISEAVMAGAFVAVTWLWVRLRETQVALTDLERQQIVAETQLTIAARVQTSLLPALPGPSAGIGWYAVVEPAGKVGGDYYDFLALPGGRMCVVLADVSGKGVGAAVFLANVRATLRAIAGDATHPRRCSRTCRQPCLPTPRAASTSRASSRSSTPKIARWCECRAPSRRAVESAVPVAVWVARRRVCCATRDSKRRGSLSAMTIVSSCRTASPKR